MTSIIDHGSDQTDKWTWTDQIGTDRAYFCPINPFYDIRSTVRYNIKSLTCFVGLGRPTEPDRTHFDPMVWFKLVFSQIRFYIGPVRFWMTLSHARKMKLYTDKKKSTLVTVFDSMLAIYVFKPCNALFTLIVIDKKPKTRKQTNV